MTLLAPNMAVIPLMSLLKVKQIFTMKQPIQSGSPVYPLICSFWSERSARDTVSLFALSSSRGSLLCPGGANLLAAVR
jgi:hypothetical protein